jgi:hypothetical protein
MKLMVGDLGMCVEGTQYHHDIESLRADLLGGQFRVPGDGMFIVLARDTIGSSGMGVGYKCAFCGGGVGWVNWTNVIALPETPDEDDEG